MTDIAVRLRNEAAYCNQMGLPHTDGFLTEAAKEIERLRRALADATDMMRGAARQLQDAATMALT